MTDNRTADRVDHSPRVRDAIDELMRKKDATDNRPTEMLREGLTERGIEWRSGLEGVTFVGDWCFVEYDNGRFAATCEAVLTPEQTIAATLGSEREKVLEELVRDMWREITTCPEYATPPCMTTSICERVRNLEIEVN